MLAVQYTCAVNQQVLYIVCDYACRRAYLALALPARQTRVATSSTDNVLVNAIVLCESLRLACTLLWDLLLRRFVTFRPVEAICMLRNHVRHDTRRDMTRGTTRHVRHR